MNLSVLQLFGAESTKVIKKQLYTNNMSCKKTVRLKGTVFFLNLVLRRLLFPDFILFRFDPDFVSDSS